MRKLTLALDFDGTIVEADYPRIGELRPDAKAVINKLYEDGHIIIINTCRSGSFEDDARDFLLKNKIKYHFINENPPESIKQFKSDCRKISADVYVDDRCVAGLPSWEEIYYLIEKKVYE